VAGLALSLVAVGGTAIIHDPDCRPARRRRRLAAIAVGVGLMVYGLPTAGRHWAQASQRQQTAVGEYDPSVRAAADNNLPG
jgi:ferric-dicitrate binding protein FerR (iron transport regulator)